MCDRCVQICNHIGELTSDEMDSVQIFHDNPDFFGPEKVIECCGYWTDMKYRRFEGETLIECLEKAVHQKRISRQPDQ